MEGTAIVEGAQLLYSDEGEGPPILFVNGLGMDKTLWEQIYSRDLIGVGARVITYNHRSVRRELRHTLTIGQLARDCLGLINALQLEGVTLIGTSLGALVVQETLLLAAENVQKAISLGTYGRTMQLQRLLVEAEASVYRSDTPFPKAYMVLMDMLQGLSRHELLRDDACRLYFQSLLGRTDYADSTRQAQLFALESYDDRLDALRGIRAPMLVVGFSEDIISPPILCREVAATIPNAQYQEVHQAGHFGPFTHHREVRKLVHSFLNNAS